MACVVVPGPHNFPTPPASSGVLVSVGMIPPARREPAPPPAPPPPPDGNPGGARPGGRPAALQGAQERGGRPRGGGEKPPVHRVGLARVHGGVQKSRAVVPPRAPHEPVREHL